MPLKDDGTRFIVDGLYVDQKEIVAEVMGKIQEWLDCSDFMTFEPLRLTLSGPGGCGKSVFIKTVVTVMRIMFEINEVVKVVAPTGASAFNAGGETFHHLLGNKVTTSQYRPLSMSSEKRKSQIKKFKVLLALIIDERSLASSKEMGTAETMIKETIYEGRGIRDLSWGGLPVVILIGDDYQLPSITTGAFDVLEKPTSEKRAKLGTMVIAGQDAFKECAQAVMYLQTNRRMSDSQIKERKLIEKIRVADPLDDPEVSRLMRLHINNFKSEFGKQAAEDIKKKSLFLFYKNSQRVEHNVRMLKELSTVQNPVAMVHLRTWGALTGKADRRHFDRSDDPPPSAMLCIGAWVCIQGRNFQPEWGLYNGSAGIVKDFQFEKGKNPNHGDLPLYVLVEFPSYCGPPWDTKNPKVNGICKRYGHSIT